MRRACWGWGHENGGGNQGKGKMKKSEKPRNGDNLPIRNSTAEFLIFAKEAEADTVPVRFQDEMLWLTLNGIATLFDVDKSVVSRHLSHIFAEKELPRETTVAKYATVQAEGSAASDAES